MKLEGALADVARTQTRNHSHHSCSYLQTLNVIFPFFIYQLNQTGAIFIINVKNHHIFIKIMFPSV